MAASAGSAPADDRVHVEVFQVRLADDIVVESDELAGESSWLAKSNCLKVPRSPSGLMRMWYDMSSSDVVRRRLLKYTRSVLATPGTAGGVDNPGGSLEVE